MILETLHAYLRSDYENLVANRKKVLPTRIQPRFHKKKNLESALSSGTNVAVAG